jgi:hypothetical protein
MIVEDLCDNCDKIEFFTTKLYAVLNHDTAIKALPGKLIYKIS